MSSHLWLLFLFRNAARNMSRTPRRTLMSLLAIATAAAAMMIFQSFTLGVKSTFRVNVINSGFAHYQITQKGYRTSDSEKPFAFQIPDIDRVKSAIEKETGPLALFGPRQHFYGLVSVGDRSAGGLIIGVDAAAEQSFMTVTKVNEGKHLSESGPDGLYMGYLLARRLHVKVGDTVTMLVNTSTGSINAADLTLTGTFDAGIDQLDEGAMYMHLKTAESLLRIENPSVLLLGFPGTDERRFEKKLETVVARDFPNLEVLHWERLARFFEPSMGWITRMVSVFRIIILIIATAGIITVFMMSLLERTGEFGTLRAIGTSRRKIIAMIFTEALLQAAAGSMLGVLFGILIITLGLRGGIVMPPPPMMSIPFQVSFVIPWAEIPVTLAICIAGAGGAGIFPAIRMARINIVTALGRNV